MDCAAGLWYRSYSDAVSLASEGQATILLALQAGMKGGWETWGGLEEIEDSGMGEVGWMGLSWQQICHFLYLPVGVCFKGCAPRLWMDELAGAQFKLFIARAPGWWREEQGWGACTCALLGQWKCSLCCVYAWYGYHKPNDASFSIIGVRLTLQSSPLLILTPPLNS